MESKQSLKKKKFPLLKLKGKLCNVLISDFIFLMITVP